MNSVKSESVPHIANLVSADEKYFEVLKDLCRNGSVTRMKAHSKADYLVVNDWVDSLKKPNESGEWLSVIFLKSTAIKVLFKVHYNPREVRQWVARALSINTQDVTNEKCQDFVKEFCNLSAGLLKTAFEEGDPKISLPFVTRGSDEGFFSADVTGGKKLFQQQWSISDLESQIFCSAEIEVFDAKSLDQLLLKSFGGDSESGDVEFF